MSRTNNVAPKIPCPYDECDGSGIIVDADAYASRACRCRPRRIARAKAARLEGLIPTRFRGVSFDRPPVTQIEPTVVSAVRRYVDDLDTNIETGRGLWLVGDVGTGKTTLAMLVSKTALERGHTVAIYSVPRLLSVMRKTFSDDSEVSFLELMDSLASVDLLHLDDLGAERTNDWVIEQLYSLVNSRYEDARPVVVTTNFQPPQLVEQVGARTVSRLTEICGDPLPLFGEDRRIAHGLPDGPAPAGRSEEPWRPPAADADRYGQPPGDWPPAEDDIRVVRGPWTED